MSRNEDLDPQLQRVKENFQKAAKAKVRDELEKLLHDAYNFVTPEGEVFNKQQLIDNVVHPTTNFLDHDFKRAEVARAQRQGRDAQSRVTSEGEVVHAPVQVPEC